MGPGRALLVNKRMKKKEEEEEEEEEEETAIMHPLRRQVTINKQFVAARLHVRGIRAAILNRFTAEFIDSAPHSLMTHIH